MRRVPVISGRELIVWLRGYPERPSIYDVGTQTTLQWYTFSVNESEVDAIYDNDDFVIPFHGLWELYEYA